MDEPFWSRVPTDSTRISSSIIHEYILQLRRHPGRVNRADLWMSRDGRTFSSTCMPGNMDIPLYPCRTIVTVAVNQGIMDHEQLYIGMGLFVSSTANILGLRGGIRYPRRSNHVFSITYVKNACNWESVLNRASSALGRYSWSPWYTNCHSMTSWILTGRRVPNQIEHLSTKIVITVMIFILVTYIALRAWME